MRLKGILVAALIGVVLSASGCREHSLASRLAKPENTMVLAYDDFGPVLGTYITLGVPKPKKGVVSKKISSGFDVGNIRVLVTNVGYLEAAWAVLEDDGFFDPELDYRIIWYFDAITLLNDVIENQDFPEGEREKAKGTKDQIVATMGDADTVRERMDPLYDDVQAHALDHFSNERLREIARTMVPHQ